MKADLYTKKLFCIKSPRSQLKRSFSIQKRFLFHDDFQKLQGMHKEKPGLLIFIFCVPAFKQDLLFVRGRRPP